MKNFPKKEDNPMDISIYLRVIARRFWLIVLSILVTMIVAAIGWRYVPLTYQSSAVIRVVPYSTSNPSYTQIVYADRIMNTYVEMGSGSVVMESLRQQMGLKDNEPLSVTIKIIPDTELLRITVEDYDPLLATNIANAFADYLINDKSIRDVRVVVLEPATIPDPPSSFRVVIYVLAAFLGGSILGFGFAILAENLDNRLYEESEITNVTSFPIFSRIPHLHPKVIEYYRALLDGKLGLEELSSFNSPHELQMEKNSCDQSYKWLAINLIQEAENRLLQSIMITSPEPQVGKSSIAVNLAYNLVKAGKKVLLVDMDLVHPCLHKYFDITMDVGLWNYLLSQASLRTVTQKTHRRGLSVIPVGIYSDDEKEPVVNLAKIRKLCKVASSHYDFVIFDSPAYLGMADCLMLSKEVDAVLIVVQLGKSLKHLFEATCKQFPQNLDKITGIVVNNSENFFRPGYLQYHKHERKDSEKKGGPAPVIVSETIITQPAVSEQ